MVFMPGCGAPSDFPPHLQGQIRASPAPSVSINAGFHLREGVTAGQESTEREGLSVVDLKKEISPGITILSPPIVSGLGFAQEEQNADIPDTPIPGGLNMDIKIYLSFFIPAHSTAFSVRTGTTGSIPHEKDEEVRLLLLMGWMRRHPASAISGETQRPISLTPSRPPEWRGKKERIIFSAFAGRQTVP
jgi:hypothetical protein